MPLCGRMRHPTVAHEPMIDLWFANRRGRGDSSRGAFRGSIGAALETVRDCSVRAVRAFVLRFVSPRGAHVDAPEESPAVDTVAHPAGECRTTPLGRPHPFGGCRAGAGNEIATLRITQMGDGHKATIPQMSDIAKDYGIQGHSRIAFELRQMTPNPNRAATPLHARDPRETADGFSVLVRSNAPPTSPSEPHIEPARVCTPSSGLDPRTLRPVYLK